VAVLEPASTRGNYSARSLLLVTTQHGRHTKHRFPLLFHPTVAEQLLSLWKHICLRSRYLATFVVYFLISRPLLSNGPTCHNSISLILQPISSFSWASAEHNY
jgi:hypothetical protein